MSNLKRFEYTLSLTVGAIIDMAKGSNANLATLIPTIALSLQISKPFCTPNVPISTTCRIAE